jgi:hypothetical protein
MKRLISATFILLVAVSCAGGGATSPSPTSPSLPAAQDPAPQALQGTWVTVLKDGSNQQVTLRLGETSYGISRGTDGASGTIAVRGDLIEFFRSSACVGTGSYRWSLTGGSLAFTESALGSEACPGRGEVLNGYTYAKSGG